MTDEEEWFKCLYQLKISWLKPKASAGLIQGGVWCIFSLDLGEVSRLHSTQMTCPKLNSKEEGQGQLLGPGWAGLEIWDNRIGKNSKLMDFYNYAQASGPP